MKRTIEAIATFREHYVKPGVTCPACIHWQEITTFSGTHRNEVTYCKARNWLLRLICARKNAIPENHWHCKCSQCGYKFIIAMPARDKVEELSADELEKMWIR